MSINFHPRKATEIFDWHGHTNLYFALFSGKQATNLYEVLYLVLGHVEYKQTSSVPVNDKVSIHP